MSDTIGAALRAARDRLAAFLPPREADREARLILAKVTGLSQAALVVSGSDPLTADPEPLLSARAARQPLSQLLGQVEFYGRPFRVTPDVLTPRQDTETLIDVALSGPFTHVLDLGTGSGCILATLLAERPGTTGLGVDVSQAALDVAAANRDALGLAERMALVASDWTDQVEGAFDLIVSNPPYISAAEMPGLAPEVRDWEPVLALTPGADGLAAYHRIAQAVPEHLEPQGRLVVEVGETQSQDVAELFSNAGLEDIHIHPDLTGTGRVVAGRRP